LVAKYSDSHSSEGATTFACVPVARLSLEPQNDKLVGEQSKAAR